MMRKICFYFGILLALSIFSAFNTVSEKVENPLLGSWVFNITQAPWEYSKGKLVFETNEENVMTGKIVFDSGFELRIGKITREEDKVTMETFVQGYPVRTIVTHKENTLSGHTETPDGNIPFSAKRYIPEE